MSNSQQQQEEDREERHLWEINRPEEHRKRRRSKDRMEEVKGMERRGREEEKESESSWP